MEKKSQENKLPEKESLADKIKDIKLKELFLLVKSKKMINPNKINLNGDLDENIKQEIGNSLKDKYHDLNDKFSELRKSGKDLGVLNFKLMIVPLKIKVFLATYEKKDAEKIIQKIEEIENEIASIKKRN
ncbi:MAG TPA: hypothetical protein VJ438_02550 [Candidatus Nanoarchaeia archaeon]|nr:hypothetical protein [Candidatus Nanoarchaeia archaeon]